METKLANYIQTYEQLKRDLKWKVSDKRILMLISSIYTLNNIPFDLDRFLYLSEEIKRQAGIFSYIRSQSRFTTAALLDVKLERPEEYVHELFQLYKKFRAAKFSSSIYTYLASAILLTNQKQDVDMIIQKAKEIYDGMAKEHPFLTSSSDYPLVVLLAMEKRPDIIWHIESFYEELAKYGFRKGNDLQFLSHILALGKDISKNDLISRVTEVMDDFKRASIKTKRMYYPLMGMLALLPREHIRFEQIYLLYEELNQQKDFRWQKDMNMMMAVSFYVNQHLEHDSLAEASLTTILETIIQAQQAVIVSTMTADAAGGDGGGGD